MNQAKSKDYIIIAIMATLTFLLGGLLVPLFQFLPFPALRAIVLTPVYSACSWTVMNLVNKRFTLFLYGIILGILITAFMPVLLPLTIISSLLLDILIPKRLNVAKAVLFPVIQFPLMMWITSAPLVFLTMPFVITVFLIGIVLGVFGIKIAKVINLKVRA